MIQEIIESIYMKCAFSSMVFGLFFFFSLSSLGEDVAPTEVSYSCRLGWVVLFGLTFPSSKMHGEI